MNGASVILRATLTPAPSFFGLGAPHSAEAAARVDIQTSVLPPRSEARCNVFLSADNAGENSARSELMPPGAGRGLLHRS